MKKIELLAPGDLEKLKIAIEYGQMPSIVEEIYLVFVQILAMTPTERRRVICS